MNEIKFLHMADIHFNRPASGIPEEKRAVRRQEVRSAFSAALALGKEKGADVILIAGDLFDTPDADIGTVSFIKNELAKIAPIPVLISPGNHDPYGNAYKSLDDGSCPNLTVFKKGITHKSFPEKGFTVYGVGFESEIENDPLLRSLHINDEKDINIALIHGEIAPTSDYNPITEEDIAKSGMDYVALGHVHSYSGIKKTGGVSYAYCGALEGGGFDECGEKGVIFGTLSKDGCNADLIPVCRRQWHTLEINVSKMSSLQEIIDCVCNETKNKNDLYKIVLTGERPEAIPPGVIENEVNAFFTRVKDCTRGTYNLEEIASDTTIGGIFAKKILERMQTENADEKEDLIQAADIVMDILNR